MTTTLHDRLARLADESSPSPDTPTGRELWDRGVRYRRQRRAALGVTAGTMAALLLVLWAVSFQQAGGRPEPAPANAPIGLPSRLYEPSPWLAGTSGAPLGQLVAVITTERGGWTGAARGVVGVSGATGDYRFLELPDAADQRVSLAPDGRHVAFWATGTPSGSANRVYGETVTALSVHDTVTGETRRYDIDTVHGLWPRQLVWLDADTLVAQHLHYRGGVGDNDRQQNSGNDEMVWRWDLDEDTPTRWSEVEAAHVSTWGTSGSGAVTVGGQEGRTLVVDEDGVTKVPGSELFNDGSPGPHAVSPDGSRIAGIFNSGRYPNDLTLVPVESGAADERRRDDVPWVTEVAGWTDEDTVVVGRLSGPDTAEPALGLYAVDLRTGGSEQLVRVWDTLADVEWASGLLDSPVTDRPAPPTPWDPRVVAVLMGLVLAIGGVLMWDRWTRVRP